MLNSSFNSDTYSKNLSRLQNQILTQYKRLGFGEQTIQYSINSINLQELPQNLPQEIIEEGRKCVKLSGCSFFEMLTYAIWEFLLSIKTTEKAQVIKKIRKQIAQKDFMQDCPSTKGLLLKGIKNMYDYVQLIKGDKLIAHCMWKNDSMMAFTEFWKALLAKLSVRNIVTADTTKSLDVGLFQLLADFLEINFNLYYETLTDFQKQTYVSRKKKSNLKLDLVVYSNDKRKKKQCSRILDSSSMIERSSIVQSLDWSYLILEDKKSYYRSQLERSDISQIKAIDESVQDQKEDLFKLLKMKTKSEINLQKLVNKQNKSQEEVLSPDSDYKNEKCLQTTRTKKSGRTTDRRLTIKSSIIKDEISSEQTERHLEVIRSCMMMGNKLVQELKQLSDKITA